MKPNEKIVIIGAGPTGLGAGYRLSELGYANWQVFEQSSHAGGLSASFTDENGFTWDLGGHVLFSHYPKFDAVIDEVLDDGLITHVRDSWIYLLNRWVPYPFQNNLKYLPKEVLFECLMGLHRAGSGPRSYSNFREWIMHRFGIGISRYFMLPYNKKVWSSDLDTMSFSWISERVPVIDFEQALKQVVFDEGDSQWGPNETFGYPHRGGIGEIFRNIARLFSNRIVYDKKATGIDLDAKTIMFTDGSMVDYDHLVSTIPLDCLVNLLMKKPDRVAEASRELMHNKALIVGLGLNGCHGSKKSWIYYPESDNPCYRVTCLSNYSPAMTPAEDEVCSFLGEISYPSTAVIDVAKDVKKTISDFKTVHLIDEKSEQNVRSVFAREIDYSYPIPSLSRDRSLDVIQPFLEHHQVYSRGRFGAWRYEIGNMDHSFMQGYEVISRILCGEMETVLNG